MFNHPFLNFIVENIIVGDDFKKVVPLDVSIKIDKTERQHFLDVVNHYNEVNKDSIGTVLRPWLENCNARKPLNIIAQYALFKCMHRECFFATDSEEKWTSHMVEHLKLIDILSQKKWLSNETRSKHIQFRECPYCDTGSKANYQVTAHIESEHRRCIFQCAFCYFRSVEIDGIVLHYDIFHHEEVQEVLVCGENCEYEYTLDDIFWECEQQYFQKINCGKFFNMLILTP